MTYDTTTAVKISEGHNSRKIASSAITYFILHTTLWISMVYALPGSKRVSFEYLGDASTPWLLQFVLPLVVVLIFQVCFLTKLGWWSGVLSDDGRTSKQWLWLPVGSFVLLALGTSLYIGGWNEAGLGYLSGLGTTVLLVGITEELSFRGVLLARGREVFAKEWQAALFASCLFGLFHLPNALLGSPLQGEIVHVVQTAIVGYLFYALRRLSGSIFLPMLVHAVWDLVVLQANWDIMETAVRRAF